MCDDLAVVARRLELSTRLAVVRESIARACAAAGRQPGAVTLVVVTKTWPASDVRLLAELGVGDVGENRDQEATQKHALCEDLALRWHFVGQLQTSKSSSVIRYAHMVHSVDRPRLVSALSTAVEHLGREPLTCLVEVNLDDEPKAGRGGVAPSGVRDLAEQIANAGGLQLGGVMGVAPLGGDAQAAFYRLQEIGAQVAEDHSSATIVSAGMSGDFVAAINAGATHVRMGAAVLGHRPPLR